MTDATSSSEAAGSTPSAQEIQDWIIDKLRQHAEELDVEIEPDQPLMSLGIDSMQFIGLIGELEEWLGCRIVDNPLPQYPTIALLFRLVGRRGAGRSDST